MKVQDVPSAMQSRWKPQVGEPQRKMMQFGSGTVKSTTVTGSCFSISRKGVQGFGARLAVHPSIQLKDTSAQQQSPARQVGATEERAGRTPCEAAALHGEASMQQTAAACAAQPVEHHVKIADAVVQPSTDHAVAESSKLQETPGTALMQTPLPRNTDLSGCIVMGYNHARQSTETLLFSGSEQQDQPATVCAGVQASVCVPEDEVAQAEQPAKAVHWDASVDVRSAAACDQDAAGASSGSCKPAKDPEGTSQALLKAAPHLVPIVLTACTSCSTGSSSAPVQCCAPRRCLCSEQLCKRAAAPAAASDRGSCSEVAAEVASHWEALGCSQERGQFAVGLVAEVVHRLGSAAAAMCEPAVLSALALFQGIQGARCKHTRCGDAVGKVNGQLHQLLEPQQGARFDAARWASVVCQAQAQTSHSEPRISQAVVRELCIAADSAARISEADCEAGEMPDSSRAWFLRTQSAALVALLAAHERDSFPSLVQSSSPQYLMQMLTSCADLASAASVAVGAVCGDLGCSSMFGRWHQAIVSFWSATDDSICDPLPVSPCVLMLQVALCATAGAAKECQQDRLTALSGEILWQLGQKIWGWCPAGPGTMRSVSAGLMQLLESAAADASSPVWSMFQEQEQLNSAVDARNARSEQLAIESEGTLDSESESSSSDDSSDSEDGRERDAAGEPQAQRSVHIVLHDIQQALAFASKCCGWKWTAHTLLDSIVWPAFERLQHLESPFAEDVRRVTKELIGGLLELVQLLSNGEAAAAEYVTTVHEALQFV